MEPGGGVRGRKMILGVQLSSDKTCFVSLPAHIAEELLSRHGDALQVILL